MNTPFLDTGIVYVHDISGVTLVEGSKIANPVHTKKFNYDLITCMQVLEHVPHPVNLLKEIILVMSDESLLYLEVPFEELMRDSDDNFKLSTKKKYWHEHINFYSENSLRSLCQLAGLNILDFHFFSFDNGFRKGEMMGLIARRQNSKY